MSGFYVKGRLFSRCNYARQYTARDKAQRVVGVAVGCVQRTQTEKMPMERLSVTDILLGSEVRVITASFTEAVSGVETSTTGNLTWDYRAPVTPETVTVNVIKPGYIVFSQEIIMGAGNKTVKVIQRINEAYLP